MVTGDQRTATAHHEAGHAGMALWLGCTFRSASIVGDENSDGRVVGTMPSWFRPDIDRDWRYMPRIEADIQCLLAGPEAERRFAGRYNIDGAAADLDRAGELAGRVHYREETLAAFVAWLEEAVKESFDNELFVEIVELLVEEVLEQDTLTYQRARQVAGSRVRPPRRWR